MRERLHMNSVIKEGDYDGTIVSEIIGDKKAIFSLIKGGAQFDDNVLAEAGIKRNVRNVKVNNIFVEHEKDTKVYEKDTASLQKILDELKTIDNGMNFAEEGVYNY